MKIQINSIFRISIFLYLLFIFSACVAIKFKTAQPENAKSISSFPKELIGKYVDNESDTMIITDCCFEYGNENSGFSHDLDSLIKGTLELKKFDDYYIMNHNDETGWIVILIRPEANGFSAYHIEMDSLKEEIINIGDDAVKEKMIVERIKKITPVQKLKEKNSDDHFYLVNPTPDQLRKMIKAGFFVKVNEFKKI
jgi:hypothetical protein